MSGRRVRGNNAWGLVFSSVFTIYCFSLCTTVVAQEVLPDDLTSVGLENLLNYDLLVTSAAKKEQRLQDVASAMFVLTNEDIQRSGASSLPDLLRLVPGVTVAQSSSHDWSVSIRGFNETYVNKLLVLIDGQSIVTPFFNGVHWETLDVVLDDIERIEVIRGPGAALWGGRAVNGVINIITRKTAETISNLARIGIGNETKISGTARHGGQIGDKTTYRVYTKFTDTDEQKLLDESDAQDSWDIVSGGLKLESRLTEKKFLSFWSHAYAEEENASSTFPSLSPPFSEHKFFDRRQRGVLSNLAWKNVESEDSDVELSATHRYEYWSDFITPYKIHTFDLDLEQRFALNNSNDVVYGLGYQYYTDKTEGTFVGDFDPADRELNRVKGFVQDEIKVVDDKLNLILGSRFEQNQQTGFEYMPDARLIWTPTNTTSFWGAVSRTRGTVSRVWDDVVVPLVAIPPAEEGGLTSLVTLKGNRSVDAEELIAYELGFRQQLQSKINWSVSTFYFKYDDINSTEPAEPYVGFLRDQSEPAVIIPLQVENKYTADSYGSEISLDWKPLEYWRLVGTYSLFILDAQRHDSLDLALEDRWESAPQDTVSLRSQFDITDTIDFDSVFRYVDSWDTANIDSYVELDLRVGWRFHPGIELSIIGRNLLDSQHHEFNGDVYPPLHTAIQRSAFVEVAIDI